MKTLNRPMFRYGGPIKEGVMNGIREPKRNGGSMGINTPKRGLVDGPGSYAGFLAPLIPAAIAAGRFAIRPLVKYGSNVLRKVGDGKVLRKGSTFIDAAGKKVKSSGKFSKVKPVFDKDQKTLTAAGRYFANSPEANLVTGAGGAISRGIYNTGKYAVKSPLTLASAAGFGGKKLYDALNAEPDKKDPAGVTAINKLKQSIGMPENLTLGGGQNYEGDPPKELTEAEKKALEAKARREQMDSYKEIMDIKGMNKDAAYKSLIDASKIIQEGGNLKEGLKDGSLIANITQAASKRFDKVSDTESALRSLVAKGEIDKVANKDKYALEKRKTDLQIKAAEKTLAGASLGETANAVYEKTGKFPTGKNLANVARTKGIEVVGIEDTAAVDEWIGENGGDEIAYMEDVIARGADVAPGPHVLRSRIIIVDSEGNVSPFF
mgnify:FL=1